MGAFDGLRANQNGAIAGREIHRFLGVPEDYRTWMDRTVEEQGLKQDEHFVFSICPKYGVDRLFTEDMAKIVCAGDMSPKGTEVRNALFENVRKLRNSGELSNDEIPPPIRMILEAEDRGDKTINMKAFYAAMTGNLVAL